MVRDHLHCIHITQLYYFLTRLLIKKNTFVLGKALNHAFEEINHHELNIYSMRANLLQMFQGWCKKLVGCDR